MRLSANLKRLRNDAGLSQQAMADSIGCTQSALSMWENGTRVPSVDAVCRIADYFGISVDTLLGRDIPARAELQPWQLTDGQLVEIQMAIENITYTKLVDTVLASQPDREIGNGR